MYLFPATWLHDVYLFVYCFCGKVIGSNSEPTEEIYSWKWNILLTCWLAVSPWRQISVFWQNVRTTTDKKYCIVMFLFVVKYTPSFLWKIAKGLLMKLEETFPPSHKAHACLWVDARNYLFILSLARFPRLVWTRQCSGSSERCSGTIHMSTKSLKMSPQRVPDEIFLKLNIANCSIFIWANSH